MAALETLPMLKKDKEKFVDIIINNSNSGGGSKLGHLYFKNIPGDGSYPIAVFFEEFIAVCSQMGRDFINPIVKHKHMEVSPFTSASGGSGGGIAGIDKISIDKICIENYIACKYMIHFYDFIEFFIDEGIINIDKSIIELLKANEITEEEFLEGVEFGMPEM